MTNPIYPLPILSMKRPFIAIKQVLPEDAPALAEELIKYVRQSDINEIKGLYNCTEYDTWQSLLAGSLLESTFNSCFEARDFETGELYMVFGASQDEQVETACSIWALGTRAFEQSKSAQIQFLRNAEPMIEFLMDSVGSEVWYAYNFMTTDTDNTAFKWISRAQFKGFEKTIDGYVGTNVVKFSLQKNL